MRTVGMGVKKEDPDAKLRAEMEAQIEHNADLMAENAKLRAEMEELKTSNVEKVSRLAERRASKEL